MSGYVTNFYETKYVLIDIFFEKDYELLKKYIKSGIQSAIVIKKAIVLKKFDNKLLYNEKHLKAKRKS